MKFPTNDKIILNEKKNPIWPIGEKKVPSKNKLC